MVRLARWSVCLSLLAINTAALGQANCSLRNPDRQIYEIFPQATRYRTIEAAVDSTSRPTIERALGSSLARTDQGTHTAYIVLKDAAPIGFVHARTEIGSRGSVELVWALDLDLAVVDFRVQRSRERQTDVIEADSFRQKLVGRNIDELRELLTEGNDAADLAAVDAPPTAASLVHCVCLCALKTRVITELAFDSAVQAARRLGYAFREFPGAGKVAQVTISDGMRQSFAAALGEGAEPLVDSVELIRVRDDAGTALGMVLRTTWTDRGVAGHAWLAVAADGTIRHAWTEGGSGGALSSDLETLPGTSAAGLASVDESSPIAQRVAREALAWVQTAGDG